MSFDIFFKQNAIKKENKKIVVSERFKDENGNSAKFEIKAISAAEDQILRDVCTELKEIPKKKGQFAPALNTTKYLSMLCAACIVYPELGNAELQDSYGVKTKPELLTAMLLPAEYQDLAAEIQNINGFKTQEDLTEEAKN